MPRQRLAESGSDHASPVASRCPSRVPPSRWSRASSGFAAKVVGEDEAAFPRNTFTRVSNNCFGVSMPERWRAARQQVNPSEITYCSRTFQVVPRGLNLCGHRRQWRAKTPPQVLGNLWRSSIRHHEGEPEYRVCQPTVRHRLRTSTSPNSSRNPPMILGGQSFSIRGLLRTITCVATGRRLRLLVSPVPGPLRDSGSCYSANCSCPPGC